MTLALLSLLFLATSLSLASFYNGVVLVLDS